MWLRSLARKLPYAEGANEKEKRKKERRGGRKEEGKRKYCFIFFGYLLLATPLAFIIPRPGTDPGHSSDNNRSLTCCATRELSLFLIKKE